MTTIPYEGLLPITRRRAWLMMCLGPASSWDNSLNGTRYDPIIRGRRDLERSMARRFRREQKHPHNVVAAEDFAHDAE